MPGFWASGAHLHPPVREEVPTAGYPARQVLAERRAGRQQPRKGLDRGKSVSAGRGGRQRRARGRKAEGRRAPPRLSPPRLSPSPAASPGAPAAAVGSAGPRAAARPRPGRSL